MRKCICAVLISLFLVAVAMPVQSAEVCYDPSVYFYNMNGVSHLSLWSVPEVNGAELWADSKESWHSELSMAAWYMTLMKAQEMGLQVVIGYDPDTLAIWYIARPRNAPCQ